MAVLAGAGMAAVDRLAVLYLAVPVALFFLSWCKLWCGIPLALAALAGLPRLAAGEWRWPPPAAFAVALGVGAVWTALGGSGHFFYANWFDWQGRAAVLRDLALLPAPVTYRIEDGVATILRAPIAYYVLPGLLGRLAGPRAAEILLYIWTLLGVLIFLLQVFGQETRGRALALVAATVVLFSGMDVLGNPPSLLDPIGHKEWWAGLFQYSSDTTLLFWVPNHALPGWLAVALLYRCRDDPRFLRLMGWIGALTLLWAPLASIGLLPFLAAVAWRHLRAGKWRPLFSPENLVGAPLVAAVAALYVMLAAGTIVNSGIQRGIGWPTEAVIYGQFVLIEFLVLAAALWSRHRAGLDPVFFGLAVAVLLLLPLFRFGPNNDLVMRASIPALAVIMFAAVDGWARPGRLGGSGLLVTVLLAVGAVTPASELLRAVVLPPWQPDLTRSLYDISQGHSPNYLARLAPDSLLARLLRTPTLP